MSRGASCKPRIIMYHDPCKVIITMQRLDPVIDVYYMYVCSMLACAV